MPRDEEQACEERMNVNMTKMYFRQSTHVHMPVSRHNHFQRRSSKQRVVRGAEINLVQRVLLNSNQFISLIFLVSLAVEQRSSKI